MATIGTLINLADRLRETDCNNVTARIIEMLAKKNEILDDLIYVECNETTSHKANIRTGLPTSIWRAFNQGVPTSKSSKAVVTFTCGELAARSECDKKLADLGGNPQDFRLSEASSHIEGMSQNMASTLFYGNEALDPNQFTGLSRYYSSLSGAASSDNVLSHGGSGNDNTSVWLVGWGEDSIHGIVPKGDTAGLTRTDKGVVELLDASGNKYDGYAETFDWTNGLAVKDWRYAARLANIDISDIKNASDLTTLKALIRNMTILAERVEGDGNWYMNRTIRTALRLAIVEKVSNQLTWETVNGKRVMVFDEKPIRRCDSLVNAESLVS